jgi:hypothetical protein
LLGLRGKALTELVHVLVTIESIPALKQDLVEQVATSSFDVHRGYRIRPSKKKERAALGVRLVVGCPEAVDSLNHVCNDLFLVRGDLIDGVILLRE